MSGGLTLTTNMLMVLGLLALTVVLFVFERLRLRVDVAAVIILVLLGLLGLVPGDELFGGFASNAVISIIAVMILGEGLDRTGVMNVVAAKILQIGGATESRVMSLISATVGVISGFMQNVGATALFMPVVSRISGRTGLPQNRLLMPMGFCAILGGTVTMVGSSPLILLNDLIADANETLPPGAQSLKTFQLFDVTPVGLSLLASGILFFLLVGRHMMPPSEVKVSTKRAKTKSYFSEVYGIKGEIYELLVTVDSPLVGMKVGEAEKLPGAPLLLAIRDTDEPRLAPPADEMIWLGSILGVMGTREQVGEFALATHCRVLPRLKHFAGLFNPARAGISEVVIPPGSNLIGKTIAEVQMRKRYGISVLAINRQGEVITRDLRTVRLELGDSLVSHSTWKELAVLANEKDFIVATDLPKEEQRPHKVAPALFFFCVSLYMILFTEFQLSISLLVGAMGMVVSRVLTMDEAYAAVSWKTVFLLASLIPLGQAMLTTGTAAWIAQNSLALLGHPSDLTLQIMLAVMATLFSLVMSNVGATTILVPIAISIALATGGNPVLYALIIGLSTSNAFIIPTHQVNALIMGPGGYTVRDYVRVGSLMSVLFLVVMLTVLNLIY